MGRDDERRSWWRKHFDDHPGIADETTDSYVLSGTGKTKSYKVYCKACLAADVERMMIADMNAVDQGRLTSARTEHEINTYCESIDLPQRTGPYAYRNFMKCGENRIQVRALGDSFVMHQRHASITSNPVQTNPPISVSRQRLQRSPQKSSSLGIPRMELRGQG